jgi:Mannosyl-glycoprotein endo-beta-N-acetylglucosaminidase/N-acetylmuramoyl-L-alanine amidase
MPSWSDLVAAARSAVIPAPALRAVTLAQWALESGRGSSELARVHGNFAGLKWRPEMEGFATKITYGAHDGVDFYSAFASAAQFIKGYWRFIGRSVYDGWRDHADDPAGYVAFLKSRGYAGDPNYTSKVLALLPEAEALLGPGGGAETGGGVAPDVDRPSRSELGQSIDDLLPAAAEPQFVSLAEVKHSYRGERPDGLEGAIVHYDAGRSRPTKGADDLEWGAKNTLIWGQSQGFAYATISRSGIVYLPGNMDWEQWGSHAGRSKCPATKREWVSQFYVGFEINSPGFVFPTDDADVFVPWFDAVRDADGAVVLNKKGHATVANKNGELYRKSQLRILSLPNGNIRPGAYVPYTKEQFTALVNVLLWLKRNFKKSFRLEHVFGHDEVSPGRKIDPGASLGLPKPADPGSAMTMAQLRSELLKAWADQQGLS